MEHKTFAEVVCNVGVSPGGGPKLATLACVSREMNRRVREALQGGLYELLVRTLLPCIPHEFRDDSVSPAWKPLYEAYWQKGIPLERLAIAKRSLCHKLSAATSAEALKPLVDELSLLYENIKFFEDRDRERKTGAALARVTTMDTELMRQSLTKLAWAALEPDSSGNVSYQRFCQRVQAADSTGEFFQCTMDLPRHGTNVTFGGFAKWIILHYYTPRVDSAVKYQGWLLNLVMHSATTESRLWELLEVKAPVQLSLLPFEPGGGSGAHWCLRTMVVTTLHGGRCGVKYARRGGSEEQWSVFGHMVHLCTLAHLHWAVEYWSAGGISVTEGAVFHAAVAPICTVVRASPHSWHKHCPRATTKQPGMLFHFSVHAGFEEGFGDESEQFALASRSFFEATGVDTSSMDMEACVKALQRVFVNALPSQTQPQVHPIWGLE